MRVISVLAIYVVGVRSLKTDFFSAVFKGVCNTLSYSDTMRGRKISHDGHLNEKILTEPESWDIISERKDSFRKHPRLRTSVPENLPSLAWDRR